MNLESIDKQYWLTKDRVILRNTYSYFKELLEFVGNDEASEFYEYLKNID